MNYSEIMGYEVEKDENENISHPFDELTSEKVPNLSGGDEKKLCEVSLNDPAVPDFKLCDQNAKI